MSGRKPAYNLCIRNYCAYCKLVVLVINGSEYIETLMTKAEGAVQDSTEFVLLLGKTKTLAPDNEKVVYILCNTIDGSFLH